MSAQDSNPKPQGKAPEAAAPQRVIALRYDESDGCAPIVVASGAGEIARHILEVAKAKGVPIHQDPDLVTLLAACDLGEEIPVELYEAVAELLTWLYRLNASLTA